MSTQLQILESYVCYCLDCAYFYWCYFLWVNMLSLNYPIFLQKGFCIYQMSETYPYPHFTYCASPGISVWCAPSSHSNEFQWVFAAYYYTILLALSLAGTSLVLSYFCIQIADAKIAVLSNGYMMRSSNPENGVHPNQVHSYRLFIKAK